MRGKSLHRGGKKVQQRNLSGVKAPIETAIEIMTTGTDAVAQIGSAVMPTMGIVMIEMLVEKIMIHMIAIGTGVVTETMIPATEIVMIVGGTGRVGAEVTVVTEIMITGIEILPMTETLAVTLAATVAAMPAATVMEVETETMAEDAMVVMTVTAAMIGMIPVIVTVAVAMVAVTMVQQHQHEQQLPQHNN